MAATVDISRTFGALLIGGLFAAILSGVVTVQVVLYFKMYPKDRRLLKILVLFIWLLDILHTAFTWSSLWDYLIGNYGREEIIDFIPWNIALTIALTAVLTFLVHCFFAHRIFMLSKRNWFITVPIVLLAVLRLVSASATTGEMFRLHSFSAFKLHFRWLFTLGLALSTCVDILITASLFFLLQTSRTGAPSLNVVIDSLIRYAFETGSLTCAGTVVSMVCWVGMNKNLIFMGLHFVISKLYANSLLVTLNTREAIRRAHSFPSGGRGYHRHHDNNLPSRYEFGSLSEGYRGQKMEISVVKSIEHVPADVPPSFRNVAYE